GPGILNWALEGLQRLRIRGRFEIPDKVKEASDQFKASCDIPSAFVSECCIQSADARTQGSHLYAAYKRWCENSSHRPVSSTRIANDWQRLGFERYDANGRRFWRGVGLLQPEPGTV